MSLTDCSECWDTPCTCGHEWRKMSIQQLESKHKKYATVLLQINSILISKKQAEYDRQNV